MSEEYLHAFLSNIAYLALAKAVLVFTDVFEDNLEAFLSGLLTDLRHRRDIFFLGLTVDSTGYFCNLWSRLKVRYVKRLYTCVVHVVIHVLLCADCAVGSLHFPRSRICSFLSSKASKIYYFFTRLWGAFLLLLHLVAAGISCAVTSAGFCKRIAVHLLKVTDGFLGRLLRVR